LNPLPHSVQGGDGKIIIKRLKVDFIFWPQVSAVIGGFLKQVLKITMASDENIENTFRQTIILCLLSLF